MRSAPPSNMMEPWIPAPHTHWHCAHSLALRSLAPHSPHLRFGAGVRAACTVPHTVPAQHLRSGQVCPIGRHACASAVGAERQCKCAQTGQDPCAREGGAGPPTVPVPLRDGVGLRPTLPNHEVDNCPQINNIRWDRAPAKGAKDRPFSPANEFPAPTGGDRLLSSGSSPLLTPMITTRILWTPTPLT